jgi:glutathione synthase/RimK-type ligase-like ATP-grasp enzyme
MIILIATQYPDPPAVELVRTSLAARSIAVHSWYPTRAPFTTHPTFRLEEETGSVIDGIELGRFSALWNRLPLVRDPLRDDLEPEVATVCRRVSESMIATVFERMRGFQVDPFWVTRRAENKLLQLDVARDVGLEVPPTLVTGDPAAVRDFARRHPATVTKMAVHWAGESAGDDDDEGPERVFTSRLDTSSRGALDGLELCPMIFQAEVPKERELRVTVVGDKVFAAAVDSSLAGGGRIDWRRDQGPLMGAWVACDLPEVERTRLLHLMDRLDLQLGCADFILTPDGRYVFLEVNVLGEFAFLEHQLDLGVTEAVADLLTQRAQPRPRRRLEK